MAIASCRQNPTTVLQDEFWSLIQERMIETSDCAAEAFEFTCAYPTQFGKGYIRDIHIREGLILSIIDHALHQDLVLISEDREHPLELTYLLAGSALSHETSIQAGRHTFCGSGMAPGQTYQQKLQQRHLTVSIHVEPALFCQWLNGTSDHLPDQLSYLVKPSDQTFFSQIRPTPIAMQVAVQQILQCPFQGLTQRMYLESKVWELMALQLAQIQDSEQTGDRSPGLKSEDVERIHYAKELLVARLNHPPSLMELARLAGINDCKLKSGFRQVFGTTVFGYLHDYRMERSRQLLEAGEMTVTEAARAVGFVSRGHFAAAFKRRFGVNPSAYVAQNRQDERFLQ